MVIQPIGLNELNRINASLMQGLQKISTGSKINKPSDNPAGYAAAKIFERDLRAAQNQQTNLERQINSESTVSSKLESATETGMRIEDLLNQASNSSLSAAANPQWRSVPVPIRSDRWLSQQTQSVFRAEHLVIA